MLSNVETQESGVRLYRSCSCFKEHKKDITECAWLCSLHHFLKVTVTFIKNMFKNKRLKNKELTYRKVIHRHGSYSHFLAVIV